MLDGFPFPAYFSLYSALVESLLREDTLMSKLHSSNQNHRLVWVWWDL